MGRRKQEIVNNMKIRAQRDFKKSKYSSMEFKLPNLKKVRFNMPKLFQNVEDGFASVGKIG